MTPLVVPAPVDPPLLPKPHLLPQSEVPKPRLQGEHEVPARLPEAPDFLGVLLGSLAPQDHLLQLLLQEEVSVSQTRSLNSWIMPKLVGLLGLGTSRVQQGIRVVGFRGPALRDPQGCSNSL